MLKLYNLDFYEILVKIHPNENQLGEKYILNILKRYPSVKIIDKNCNNLEIIKNGLIVGITLHGTIGLELAYHKIPTIYGHDNPYVAFNFCLKSSSIKQYKKQLKKIHTLKKNIKYRQEAFQFYYMHNFYVPSNKIKNNEIVNLKKFYNYRGNGQTNIIKSFLKDSRKKIDEKLNILEGCFDNAVI